MVLQVPTVQLESNAPSMMRGGQVVPQQDVVTQDIQKLGKAQQKVGQDFQALADKLQDERDDAVFTEKHNEFQMAVNEKTLEYLSKRNNEAIKQVGVDEETGEPITVLDQLNADLSGILANFEDSLENDAQKYMFRTAASSTLMTSKNKTTTHFTKESQSYADNNFLSAIDLAAEQTASEWENAFDPLGDFFKMNTVTMKLAERYCDRNGFEVGSARRDDFLAKTQNIINTHTLNNMIAAKEWDNARHYLDTLQDKGLASAELVLKFEKVIHEGYSKDVGINKAKNLLFNNGNSNSGNHNDIAADLQTLDTFNIVDDGSGASIKHGFRSSEIDTSTLTEDQANIELEKLAKTSKFYKPETNEFSIIPQHKTLHLFTAKHFGMEKADSIYSKAKSELKRLGVDPESKDYNNKLVDLVIGLANEEAELQFGDFDVVPLAKTDTPFTEKFDNDMQKIKSRINYEYDGEPDYPTNEYGMRTLSSIEKELKETISDDTELEYALSYVRKEHAAQTSNKKEEYDATFEKAKDIAFASADGWQNLLDNGIDINMFSSEDIQELKNGHPDTSDTNTILFLNANPEIYSDEDKLKEYRGKLTQSKYLEYVSEGQKLKNGGPGAVIEASVDEGMLNKFIKDYGYEDWFKDTSKGSDYDDMRYAVKKEINKRQIQKGQKLSLEEKEDAAAFVFNNKVLVQGKGKELLPLGSVDVDEYKKAYVKVGGKKVFLRAINDYQREQIIQSFIEADKGRPTEQQIAEYWVREGMPRDTGDGGKSPLIDKAGNIVGKENEYAAHYLKTRTGGIIWNWSPSEDKTSSMK